VPSGLIARSEPAIGRRRHVPHQSTGLRAPPWRVQAPTRHRSQMKYAGLERSTALVIRPACRRRRPQSRIAREARTATANTSRRSSMRPLLATRPNPASSRAAAVPPAPSLPVSDNVGHARRSAGQCRFHERLSRKPLVSSTFCASVTRRRFRSESFHSRRACFVRLRRSYEVGENCRCRFRTTAWVYATASRISGTLT